MEDAFGRWQTVLVLGGTSEIALAIVRALPLRGDAVVVLAGRDQAALAAVAGTLDCRTAVVSFDAGRVETHDRLLSDIVAAHGDIDLVLAAAGTLGDEERAHRSAAAALDILHTNFSGMVSVLTGIGCVFERQRHGVLVVLSSIAAVRARPSNYVYGAAKAGLDAFASGLGARLGVVGCRVVVVRPGFVRTRMTEGRPPAPFATTPDVVGAAVARALAGRQSVVYTSGTVRAVALALRLVPAAIVRRLPG